MDRSLEGSLLSDQYRIERWIAAGGMSQIYLARDERHGRRVAVKVLSANVEVGATDARFQREVDIVAGLSHPHVLPLYQSGVHEGLFYFVTPYVEGATLKQRLADGATLPMEEALRIAAEVADGLQYAHGEGVIHRDIKPGNIFLLRGHAVLADFGIAKAADAHSLEAATDLTEVGSSIGTPLYMSPEQALEGSADERSDIYSLGCVLYEMLTGTVPLRGKTRLATHAQRQTGAPPPPSELRNEIPHSVDVLVLRALAPQRKDRFPDAKALLEELRRAIDGVKLESIGTKASMVRFPVLGGSIAAAAVLVATSIISVGRADSGIIRTVAVLPFEQSSARGSPDAYLTAGIEQAIREALAQSDSLRVASETSSSAAAAEEASMIRVGERLGVRGLIRGAVDQSDQGLRIAVSLADGSDGDVWSGELDGPRDDVLGLQEALIDSLFVALGLPRDEPRGADPLRSRTTDVATHNLYLQGRFAAADRTPDALARAETFFRSAIERDSLYAPAWAALASTYALNGVYEYRSWIDLRDDAEAAAQRAIELDGSLAEAYAALGVLLDYGFRWAEAETAYQRALELNPSYATAYHWYAVSKVLSGRPEGAVPLIERARSLDPLSFTIAAAAAWVHYYARDLNVAIERLEATLELEPNAWVAMQYLGLANTDLGHHAEGIAALERAIELNPAAPSLLPGLARAHALAGDRVKARAMLEDATGKGFIVTKGAFVGKNDGKVTEIFQDEVIITEKSTDILGETKIKDIRLRLHEQEAKSK